MKRKIRLKTVYASPTRSGRPGQVLEFSGKEADDLVAGGYGEEVKENTESPPPSLLDNSIPDLTEAIADESVTGEELNVLLKAEKAGDNRKGAIEAITDEIESREDDES